MSGLSGYDAWKTATPYDDDDGEVACDCDGGRVPCCHDDGCGECGGTGERQCRTCGGTGAVLASDDDDCNEDGLTDAEADHDALEGAGLGSEES